MGRKKLDESPAALAAFEAYYALGPRRSLRRLAEDGVSTVRRLEQWSARYAWTAQVLARQHEEVAAAREAARKEAANLARRRLRNAQVLQEAGLTILAKARIADLTDAMARDLLRTAQTMIESGMRAERLELGESTETLTIAPPKPLAEMSDEELVAYIAALEPHT